MEKAAEILTLTTELDSKVAKAEGGRRSLLAPHHRASLVYPFCALKKLGVAFVIVIFPPHCIHPTCLDVVRTPAFHFGAFSTVPSNRISPDTNMSAPRLPWDNRHYDDTQYRRRSSYDDHGRLDRER